MWFVARGGPILDGDDWDTVCGDRNRAIVPLEQAPDQIAERPLVTDKVTDVPMLNEADPLLPVATLMPAGLEVTRSPLRPPALTVSVAVCGGGGGGGGGEPDVTVRGAVFVTAFNVAEIVTCICAVTPVVVMLNTAL